MRAAPRSGFNAILLENPARLMHHLILDSHGNAQLRLAIVAKELGAEMRTLQRTFASEYQTSMARCQVEVRLVYSQWLLSIFPPTKITAVAAILGYDRVQDFNRFFKKHMRESPAEWGRKERQKTASEAEHASPG